MLNIKFKIDKNILARLVISKNYMPKEFANYLWDKYRLSYVVLQRNYKLEQIDNNIIKELQNQKFFKDYCDEAEQNLKRIQTNWLKNSEKINKFLTNIFKKDFLLDMTAIIVFPRLNVGENIVNNQFVWGHLEGVKDEAYDLTYLVHESLHSYFKRSLLTHTIIENISDIELAKYLKHSEQGYECHNYTKNLHLQIFPFWNLYLGKTKVEIEKEQKINNINYNIDDFQKFESKVKDLNIDEFINFIETIDIEKIVKSRCFYYLEIKDKK